MADARTRLAALATKLYETRPEGVGVNLHQAVPGRTWVLVGRGGKRWWVRFLEHRDVQSIRALDDKDIIVLGRNHVLRLWTMPSDAVQLKMLTDNKRWR
jgi:hypothetical protein